MDLSDLVISTDPNLLNKVIFYDDDNLLIGTLEKDDLKFNPLENETREDTARRFIGCLKLYFPPKDKSTTISIDNKEVLKYTQQEIYLTDDPSKPSDYWIFQSVKRLWTK